MHRVELGHHPVRVIADHDRLDAIRVEDSFRQPRIYVVRKRADDKKPVLLLRHLISMVAGFCGAIMRWAKGVPGNMIHGPPGTGASLMPVVLYVAYGV